MARKPTRARALGVTDERYAELLAAQHGHCALCPTKPKTRRLHVDHDHATGKIRGLLCYRCNRALPAGLDADWHRHAAEYLNPKPTTRAELLRCASWKLTQRRTATNSR